MEGPADQPRSEQPPRHDPALQPLAREHSCALKCARDLTAAATSDQRRAALGAFVQTWNTDIAPHFDDEECLLLPLIKDCEGRRRLLGEHEDLRRLAAAAMLVGPDPDPEWVRRLGQRLHDHLRWEERELFPAIEAGLGAEERARVAEATRRIEERRAGARKR